MEEKIKILYIKCTQRNYPLSFKFAVVREVESGAITNNGAMRKYGIQGHETINECRRKFCNFRLKKQLQQILRRVHNKKSINWSRDLFVGSSKRLSATRTGRCN